VRKRELERRLSELDAFEDPRVELEQYPTSGPLAAHLVHFAAMQGDLERRVLDLGAGTGLLGLGAALVGADVVGVEIDADALAVARRNADRLGVDVEWVQGDVRRLPFRLEGATVVSNPPFGAQDGRRGADRPFLAAAARVAVASCTIHNAGSREFVESFAADNGGTVTHAFRAETVLPRQFEFHDRDRDRLEVEVYRIEWRN